MNFKPLLRRALQLLRLDLTPNLKYDRLTRSLMRQTLKPDSNCIDVGCYKGEVLQTMLQLAPHGQHFAFEPLPHLCNQLNQNFPQHVKVYPFALSDNNATSDFCYIKNAAAYSGLKKRKYNTATPQVETIQVESRRLDDIITGTYPIHFIKIDVEGAELLVLKGARELILRCRPVIVFECGLGASDFYGTTPEAVFDFITNDLQMKISLLSPFIQKQDSLSRNAFIDIFYANREYYFVAHA